MRSGKSKMRVLVIDIGGTNIKMLVKGQGTSRRFPSGPMMTPSRMVADVKALSKDWDYDVVAIGFPGIVKKNRILSEPHNLAAGWTRFNFRSAFRRPVRIMNDAAMQALGSYKKGTLLFLGLGTGLGSAIVSEGTVLPMELAHLSYKGGTFEDYMGKRGFIKLGIKEWTHAVALAVERLKSALHPDEVVLGGGNAKYLQKLPPGCRLGHNKYALVGGERMWQDAVTKTKLSKKK
jgi:polyphosphate glucokinase